MSDNPFAVLTVVVAPAILTNACSVLALGTSNRIARVVDRTRVVLGHIRNEETGSGLHESWREQLDRLRRRGRLLFTALRAIYAALGAFAACALFSVVGAVGAYYELAGLGRAVALLALATGFLAVGALVTAAIVIVAEIRLALLTMEQGMDDSLSGRPGRSV
ncbi:MAG TPA: DUF2721 domain-containing protein [Polyangiaceae bacterium]|nr:DUF2721 domain-containing protein [Polyangiaceae bacterium]